MATLVSKAAAIDSALDSSGILSLKDPEQGTLSVRVFNKIEEIPAGDWNRVFPPVLEGYDFFRALEMSDFKEFSFYYILVYQDQSLVGVAPCFLMNYPLDTTVKGSFKALISGVKKFLPDFFNLRVLICGMPLGPGRIGVVGNRQSIFEAVTVCMEQIAEKEKVPILAFKDFGADDTEELDKLQARGFYKFASLPNTELEIRFKNFEEYLKTLSRATRSDLRRKFKKIDGHVKIDFEIRSEVSGVLDEVHGLFKQTASRGEIQFEETPKEFFENISKTMPGRCLYFLWRINNKLAAFTLCLISGDRLIDYYLGLDYAIAYQYHLYFVRYRDLLRWCIKNGIKKYEMGNTTYEPKKRLDFKLIPLFAYAKHRTRWVNPFFHLLCKIVKPENFEKVLKSKPSGEQERQAYR